MATALRVRLHSALASESGLESKKPQRQPPASQSILAAALSVDSDRSDGLSLATPGGHVSLIRHMAKQREADPPFSPDNILAGVLAGATVEVDVRRCADGFVLLHGDKLELQTTSTGAVLETPLRVIKQARIKNTQMHPLSLIDAIMMLRDARAAGSDGKIMLDLKVPETVVSAQVAREFAEVLNLMRHDKSGVLLSSGEIGGLEALCSFCPGFGRAFDPKKREMQLRDAPPTEPEPWQELVEHVIDTATQFRLGHMQVFVNARSVLAASRAGVDLVASWRALGYPVGVWTMDAGSTAESRASVAAELVELLNAPVIPNQIITNGAFELQALWNECDAMDDNR